MHHSDRGGWGGPAGLLRQDVGLASCEQFRRSPHTGFLSYHPRTKPSLVRCSAALLSTLATLLLYFPSGERLCFQQAPCQRKSTLGNLLFKVGREYIVRILLTSRSRNDDSDVTFRLIDMGDVVKLRIVAFREHRKQVLKSRDCKPQG